MFEVLENGAKVRFHHTLWVHYGGAEAKREGEQVVLTGREEEAYLKVLNHFGRVLKLFVWEKGKWVDAETGQAPGVLDESLAGRVPATQAPKPAVRKPTTAGKTGAAKPAAKKPRSGKAAAAKAAATPRKPAPKKRPGGKAGKAAKGG